MKRIEIIAKHLAASSSSTVSDTTDTLVSSLAQGLKISECIGEMENREVNADLEDSRNSRKGKKAGKDDKSEHSVFKYRFVRHAIKIVFDDPSIADERYGGSGTQVVIEGELIKPDTASSSVIIFMHPSGIQNLLPMPVAMARAGLHVVTCTSRYPNNDSCLIMEKVAIDLGACVRHMKEKHGYKTVVLCGWSGGGSLSSFYQSQAENPRITRTPAGDKVDLKAAKLIPADGLLIMAAHISRAKIFTEWIDPAVIDENDPWKRDIELDLFDPRNPNKPPYTKEYIAKFRAAQIARNKRITEWCRKQLKVIDERYENIQEGWEQKRRDIVFNVNCTQADIRRLDVTIDPNGRKPTSIAELASENHSPVGLAKFTTARSFLSQWSYEASQADGPASLSTVKVPILVVANEADHLVPLTHPQEMYDAIKHSDKELYIVKGATHYYFGQQEKLAEAVSHTIQWLRNHQLLEPAFKSA